MFNSKFFFRLSKIIQLGKPPGRVDSGTNIEWSSSQNMRTGLKIKKAREIDYFLHKKMWTWLNYLYLYPQEASYVFIPPQCVFHIEFEFNFKSAQRHLVHQH